MGGGSVRGQALHNTIAGKITANAGITLTSNNGSINTSAGTLDGSSSLGNGGAIALSAGGDIITNQIQYHVSKSLGFFLLGSKNIHLNQVQNSDF